MNGDKPRSPARIVGLLLMGTVLALTGSDRVFAFDNLVGARLVAVPKMSPPGYLEPSIDPVFGTALVRVTDPGKEFVAGISCDPAYCRHRYSSAQAWNADQSLLVIQKGCPGLCFLDGQNYRPLFQRRASGACEWHPTDPAQMICVSNTEIYRWLVRSDERITISAPTEYRKMEFGPGKNNLSRDGNRLVVRAVTPSGEPVAFAYDIQSETKYPDVQLEHLKGSNNYCTISPSGQYVFCSQGMPDNSDIAYIFSLDGHQVQHWAEHHRPGHGDMTTDNDGSDVYVGISKSEPDKYQVIKRRLSDGKVTVLTPRGSAQHASVRSINRPGWVFLTYSGSYERAGRSGATPFYGEIVALRIDGSGEIRRIVHHRSAKHDYVSEAHASPSPDGSQVIWASNWGRPGEPVAAYVARLSWPETVAAQRLQGCPVPKKEICLDE
jgi:hypothetical protein